MPSRRPLRVVVTGSECTGKTTLAARLAGRHGAGWSPEYVRSFVERERRAPEAGDVEAIARGQIAGEEAAEAHAEGLVVRDTDLVSTLVYARHYFSSCPEWIERAARERLGDLYLLCHPDVEWRPDGLHRDRPAARDEIHALFRETLRSLGACVVDVLGPWAARDDTAARAVEELLSRR